MKKVIITFNPDGVVTWEPMPTDAEIPAPYTTPFCLSPRAEKPVKPHQFNKEYRVECTPEQREEIIRVSRELGRSVYGDTPEQGEHFKNLFWSTDDGVVGSCATQENDPTFNWIPFPEFLARLKGEWEPAQEEMKHADIAKHDIEPEVLAGLNLLPEPYRSQAIENAEILGPEQMFSKCLFTKNDIQKAILCAFLWEKSEQGDEYWSGIHERAERGEFNPSNPKPDEPAQEKPEPYYSRLVGKWVRCINDLIMDDGDIQAISGKWYPIVSNEQFIDEDGEPHYFGGENSRLNSHGGVWARQYFDLTDPRDSNPLEKAKP